MNRIARRPFTGRACADRLRLTPMLPPLVMKFGGAALADGKAVLHACGIIRGADRPPIVVVSAHEGVTAQLEQCARQAAAGTLDTDAVRIRHRGLLRELELDPELLDRHFFELRQVLVGVRHKGVLLAEELDFVLSFGERLSARVVAAALRKLGSEATPVDAFDLGLTTDSCYGRAQPLPGVEASLRESLRGIPGLAVVTGFLAKDDRGNLTTMGRNGSDLTAALVAQAVGAERLVYYKDVAGIMSGDPRRVQGTQLLVELSLSEAAELAFHGAGVLHPRALEPLRGSEVTVEVRHIARPDQPGTRILGTGLRDRVIGVTGFAELEGIEVESGDGGGLNALFALLHARHIHPRAVASSAIGLCVWAPRGAGLDAVRLELSGRARSLGLSSSVVIVGGGSEAGRRGAEALARAGIEPQLEVLGGSTASQLFLLDVEGGPRAMQVLHAELLSSGGAVDPELAAL